jgi:hypothetical protein
VFVFAVGVAAMADNFEAESNFPEPSKSTSFSQARAQRLVGQQKTSPHTL